MLDKFFVIKHIQNKNVYYCQYLLTSLHKHKIVTNFINLQNLMIKNDSMYSEILSCIG